MGIYVDIYNSRGQNIASGKYGVGFAILMFSRYERNKKKFHFVADGNEAINNLEKYLSYINGNMTAENEDRLLPIEHKLMELRSKIKENDSYVLDYSEIMECSVDNPSYNPMRPVIEMADKIDDAIWGYSRFGKKDTIEAKMMMAYLKSLNPQIQVSSLAYEMKHSYVFDVTLYESSADSDYLETILLRTDDKDNWQTVEYYERKLFMILKKSGLEFEWLRAENRRMYVMIDKDYMKKLLDTKPFVVCSYRWNTTHDIYHLLANNPEEKEKFYSYLKAQDTDTRKLESVIIDGVELINMTADEVAQYIGTSITGTKYDFCDVVLYDL